MGFLVLAVRKGILSGFFRPNKALLSFTYLRLGIHGLAGEFSAIIKTHSLLAPPHL